MTRFTAEPITGRYVQLELLGKKHRLYMETSGQGIPLLCLHTAGADCRQYRAVQNDPWILENFEVICFDLPYHGKSSPPEGWHDHEYQLTADDYVQIVLELREALELDRPVLLGCSIGGRLVVDMAIDHSDLFRALIGLQAGAHVPPYYDSEYLNRPDVNGGLACAGAVSGLVGPFASDETRWETLWHYMQGGPGVFKGDLFFYNKDTRGDLRTRLASMPDVACPLYLLSGDYDYSCSPEDTLALVEFLPTAKVTIMPGIGHFPMSESPEQFLEYLHPVLEEIVAQQSAEVPA